MAIWLVSVALVFTVCSAQLTVILQLTGGGAGVVTVQMI